MSYYSCSSPLAGWSSGLFRTGNGGVMIQKLLYRVAHKNRTVDTVEFFKGLCSNQQSSFFTLLDRTSFPHYNNTKIIKYG